MYHTNLPYGTGRKIIIMGSITVCCPEASEIASIITSLTDCNSDVGQIQKLVFWRTGNSIAAVTTALIQTEWDTLLAAADDTKAVVSPFVNNPTMPAGDPREFGGGNETRWGSAKRKGTLPTLASYRMDAEDQDNITVMKALSCEYLDVIFINEANQFIYSDAGNVFAGFPIIPNSLIVGDKTIGGFDEWDSNMLFFDLQPNWSDTLEITVATDFALAMVNA